MPGPEKPRRRRWRRRQYWGYLPFWRRCDDASRRGIGSWRMGAVGHWLWLLRARIASLSEQKMVPQVNSNGLSERLRSHRLGGRAMRSLAMVGMFVAAIVGAALNWAWWLEYAMITPSAILYIASGRLVVYRQLSAGSSDRRAPVGLVVPVLLAGAIEPTGFSGASRHAPERQAWHEAQARHGCRGDDGTTVLPVMRHCSATGFSLAVWTYAHNNLCQTDLQ